MCKFEIDGDHKIVRPIDYIICNTLRRDECLLGLVYASDLMVLIFLSESK